MVLDPIKFYSILNNHRQAQNYELNTNSRYSLKTMLMELLSKYQLMQVMKTYKRKKRALEYMDGIMRDFHMFNLFDLLKEEL